MKERGLEPDPAYAENPPERDIDAERKASIEEYIIVDDGPTEVTREQYEELERRANESFNDCFDTFLDIADGTDYGDTSQFELTGEGRKPNDAYYTPAYCTELLYHVDVDQLPEWFARDYWDAKSGGPLEILEPCAGTGGIADVLIRNGEHVFTADLSTDVSVGYPGLDFLSVAPDTFGIVDAIVTNPPYKYAAEFVRKALTITPNVAMFLRSSFYEDCLNRGDLVRALDCILYVNRVPFIEGSTKCDSVPHAWFFWSRHKTGRTTISHAGRDIIALAKGQQELGI